MEEFLQSGLFNWVVLPALIFCARVIDVSMGTVRMILVTRGIRWLAPMIGFFEVILWLLAMGQIMLNLSNPACYVAFGAGYATGTYVGMLIESRLNIGKAVIETITARPAQGLVDKLRQANCGVTSFDALGANGPVKIIFSVIERRDMARVIALIKEFDPAAFYTISDVKHASEGVFPQRESVLGKLARLGK
ncbi:MAG TPA: DUF2179 domain-containing protein [Planctomycetota bacterium]|nr:DUF2179 domain-containing protein [Planctomycetota bacterium]OQC21616.1 MAG: hypothetical protein BWX69_00830 [Planctomycetes bacterium ADurb.Bin069]NMD36761.1 DUF2179 domain-containing protein [Planctomycetota bacterium]HNR98518.1 DUF2179 domain-containing protein [Planctomycetota bacterium]HNU26212.1 DUF2179 domain-containing protein [Planctomycetota bacterium]